MKQRQSIATLLYLTTMGCMDVYMHDDVNTKRIYHGFLLTVYLLQDMIFYWRIMKWTMILHHGFALSLSWLLMNEPDLVLVWDHVKTVLMTEVSTIFFALHGLGVRYRINELCFFISFLYFRTWRLGRLLFIENHAFQSAIIMVRCLYALNLYWTYHIFRHLYQKHVATSTFIQ